MSEFAQFDHIVSQLADRYAIGQELGRGGMAIVYEAHDIKHDRPVAIKVLKPELGVTLGAERFLREISIEARLQHPNILALFDSGQIDEFLYYVMPRAEGGSLRNRLERERPLSIEDAVRITREIADALGHAHSQGVVHRDVKPGNILFSSGHAVLADFGIAQAVADVGQERLTHSGMTIGTPVYMSPEQAAGGEQVDARSDIYSLGCVLFEMLAGDPPFTGSNARVVLARQLSERLPSIEVARPEVPPNVARALREALAKEPADRFATTEELIEALEQPSELGRAEKRGPASRTLRLALAVVLMIVGAASAWWIARPDGVPLSPNKIAVFPLSSRAVQSSLDGTGVTYLIEAALEHAAPLEFIDVTNRLSERQLEDPELVTAAEAREIASTDGAAFYLTGVIQGHGDSTTVILRVYDVEGDSLIEQRSATGAVETVPLHHLGIDATLGLLPSLIDPAVEVDMTPLRDRTANAIALWIQGEREYRTSSFAAALDHYERALEQDSLLAIAAVKGAQAADWLHERDRGRLMVRAALAREELLPEKYVILARGLNAFFSSQADSAAFLLAAAVEAYPDWWEAAAALGEVYYHTLPASTAPLDSLARAAFERGLAVDSFSPSLFHLAEIYIRNGDLEESDRLLRRFRQADPDPALLVQLNLMRQCVGTEADMNWDRHAQVTPTSVLLAGKSLSVGALQHECAEGAFRSLLHSRGTPASEGWGAFLGLQGLLIATGRDGEALALIDSVAATKGAARSLYVLGALAGAGMENGASELESFARERYGETYEGVRSSESLWILASWLYQANDLPALEAILSLAARRAASDSASVRDRFFGTAIAVRGALLRDSTEALHGLSSLPSGDLDDLAWGFGSSLPPERLLLAELLLSQGRNRESLVAASVFDHPEPIMFLPYVPRSLVVRYEAALASGDDVAAASFRDRLESLHRAELTTARH